MRVELVCAVCGKRRQGLMGVVDEECHVCVQDSRGVLYIISTVIDVNKWPLLFCTAAMSNTCMCYPVTAAAGRGCSLMHEIW